MSDDNAGIELGHLRTQRVDPFIGAFQILQLGTGCFRPGDDVIQFRTVFAL